MGRVQGYWQATPLNCGSSLWPTFYAYDLAGDVTSWLHPAGFVINQTINGARQVTQVTSSWSDTTSHPGTLAQNITYNAAGQITSLQNGCVGSQCTGLQETYFYNNHLQMAVAELGTSSTHAARSCRVYSYYVGAGASNCSESSWPTGTNNNGDVAGYYYSDNEFSLGHTATYTYDPVNRLSTAVATGNVSYNETFTYTGDGSNGQFGNMDCTASPSERKCLAPTYSATTNQIAGYSYDAAGNVTNDGTFGYQWDAEGHMVAITQNSQPVVTNVYNALGQNVRHVGSGETTDMAYGAGGSLLWRNTGGDAYTHAFVPFNGRLLADYTSPYYNSTLFYHPDELGSLTTATDQTGNNSREMLFSPFGELLNGAGTLPMHQTFAQLPDYDNDANSDLYNTLNRHYTPSGRWLSPDPLGGSLSDPQTLNRYPYVRNNPTTLTDPLGLGPRYGTEYCGILNSCAGTGLGGGCIVDGAQTPCGIASTLIAAGAAAQCPNNSCPPGSIASFGPLGSTVFSQWMPPYQVTETILGTSYPGRIVKGRWVTIATVGGLQLSEEPYLLPPFLEGIGAFGEATEEAASFFKGTTLSEKVLGQMKTAGDIFHSFPESVEAFEDVGKVTTWVNNSGQFWKLSIPGSYGGYEGAFEFIKDEAGVISHYFFNPVP
jgi:RHS repeat-associated protein